MKPMKRTTPSWMLADPIFVLLVCFSISSVTTQAQSAGNKAVYNSTSTCCTFSSASIDAYAVSTTLTSPNFCGVLNYILTPSNHILASTGGVIDARGLNSTNVGMTCTISPWSGITNPPPSTILLPSGTIGIGAQWIMPDGTRIIGEGVGGEITGGGTTGTILQANITTGTLIQLGDSGAHCPASGHVCHGVSVEDLTLDGEGNTLNGIVNANSQELSYVKNVKFYQILGTGLTVSTNAQNSGPYSNITFDTGGKSPVSSTSCAQIIGLRGTRGIHGLTCLSITNSPAAAVSLDSSGNTIEDVLIEGFDDGIRVGQNGVAQSNVLFNVFGDTNRTGVSPINVIHVASNSFLVSDLSIVGVRNTGSDSLTIKDDQTTTYLSDPTVAMYVLGRPGLGGSGYSRFTTSPNAATWAVGSASPSGGCTANNFGSIYSSTPSTGSGSMWVCENSSTGPTWTSLL